MKAIIVVCVHHLLSHQLCHEDAGKLTILHYSMHCLGTLLCSVCVIFFLTSGYAGLRKDPNDRKKLSFFDLHPPTQSNKSNVQAGI